MHQLLLLPLLFTLFCQQYLLGQQTNKASNTTGANYKLGVGFGTDLGTGLRAYGASAKYFLSDHHVIKAEVLLGEPSVLVSAFYQYHGNFPDAPGLRGTIGVGVSKFVQSYSDNHVDVRPSLGMDYKIYSVPIVVEVDWRPFIYLGGYGRAITVAQFGLALRYALLP